MREGQSARIRTLVEVTTVIERFRYKGVINSNACGFAHVGLRGSSRHLRETASEVGHVFLWFLIKISICTIAV